jgi:hypothetical protein
MVLEALADAQNMAEIFPSLFCADSELQSFLHERKEQEASIIAKTPTFKENFFITDSKIQFYHTRFCLANYRMKILIFFFCISGFTPLLVFSPTSFPHPTFTFLLFPFYFLRGREEGALPAGGGPKRQRSLAQWSHCSISFQSTRIAALKKQLFIVQ